MVVAQCFWYYRVSGLLLVISNPTLFLLLLSLSKQKIGFLAHNKRKFCYLISKLMDLIEMGLKLLAFQRGVA